MLDVAWQLQRYVGRGGVDGLLVRYTNVTQEAGGLAINKRLPKFETMLLATVSAMNQIQIDVTWTVGGISAPCQDEYAKWSSPRSSFSAEVFTLAAASGELGGTLDARAALKPRRSHTRY